MAALIAETVVSIGIPLNQNDSAAKIAHELDKHSQRILVVAAHSIIYALGFLIYLGRLNIELRRNGDDPHRRFLSSFVLIGGTSFLTLHAVSDIGIDGLLGSKLASYSAQPTTASPTRSTS